MPGKPSCSASRDSISPCPPGQRLDERRQARSTFDPLTSIASPGAIAAVADRRRMPHRAHAPRTRSCPQALRPERFISGPTRSAQVDAGRRRSARASAAWNRASSGPSSRIVAEHRDLAAPCSRPSIFERRAHRGGVGVVALVDQQGVAVRQRWMTLPPRPGRPAMSASARPAAARSPPSRLDRGKDGKRVGDPVIAGRARR